LRRSKINSLKAYATHPHLVLGMMPERFAGSLREAAIN
jgi:hypothetical protein